MKKMNWMSCNDTHAIIGLKYLNVATWKKSRSM